MGTTDAQRIPNIREKYFVSRIRYLIHIDSWCVPPT